MYIRRVCTCRYTSTTYGRPPQKVLLDVVHDLQLLECPALMDALNQAAGYENGQWGGEQYGCNIVLRRKVETMD